MLKEEKQLKEMSDYHRKQSGFTEDDAPPTPQAYEEKKAQYDSLAERVMSNRNYDYLRDKVRSKDPSKNDKKKSELDIERLRGTSMSFGYSRQYSNNYDKIFNK